MVVLNIPLLLWLFGCDRFIEASNALTSATPITPSMRWSSPKITEKPFSAPTEGESKAAAAGTRTPASPTPTAADGSTEPSLAEPAPTEEKSALTMAAFGVISFIVVLVVVVIVLVSVVSLRFKCNRSKDAEDKQKPGSSVVSESCSAAAAKKGSVTLISMKNFSTNNSPSYTTSEKVL
ncbi:endothelial cell-specific chemotaxis regulator [Carettochelys insculpta]|uniref:endothelial cell-specific chemotaxis regulator n=1 Tax=Carettochelys insculpta TaxID=44489 RepID=UPI003EBEFABA